METQLFGFDRLPAELFHEIAGYLNTSSLSFFACTNKVYLTHLLPSLEKRQNTLLDYPNIKLIAGDSSTYCYSKNKLFVCGNNESYQLGLKEKKIYDSFIEVNDISGKILQVASRGDSTFLLTDEALWACGDNGTGQLGFELTNNDKYRCFQKVNNIAGKILLVATGGAHTFVSTSQGLYACGFNGSGELGLGNNKPQFLFTKIDDDIGHVLQMALGSDYTILLTVNGLYVCGDNTFGQLGLEADIDYAKLQRIESLPGKISQIATGEKHTFVLTEQGLYACGDNFYGQLGIGSTNKQPAKGFKKVEGITGKILKIVLGSNHTFILTDRQLLACGCNADGQLGLENKELEFCDVLTEVKNIAGKIIDIITGSEHTLILTSQGLYACGYNDYGQLGLSPETDNKNPVSSIENLPHSFRKLFSLYGHIDKLKMLIAEEPTASLRQALKRELDDMNYNRDFQPNKKMRL